MKRITCVVAALGLLVGACGGGDDEPAADDSADGSTEAPADEPAAEEPAAEEPAAEEPAAEEPAAEEPSAEEPSAEEPAPDEEPVNDDGDNDGDGVQIRSMNDVPEVCREEMARFLREVEPIVSQIDWETATLADFEQISDDFDRASGEFNTSSISSGCDDLEFVDGNEFELLIEFARDEAPGTVGFFEFFTTLSGVASGDGGDAGSAGGDELETCDDAIAFVQGLLDSYDSLNEVPAAELVKFTQLSSLFFSCTPEQLEFLEGDAVSEFLGG